MSKGRKRTVPRLRARVSKLPSLRLLTRPLRWPDLAVFPLVLTLSILPLLWFSRNWTVGTDGSRYLLLGWNLISGEGYEFYGDVYSLRSPAVPALLPAQRAG